MFNYDLTLNEFVCSIPICQAEADLGSILHIFNQTQCDSLAVSGKNNAWGTISSGGLLSLLAAPSKRSSVFITGHPKKGMLQEDFAFDPKQDLRRLIQPAIVYQADTTLSVFFKSFGDNYFRNNHHQCLVVNSAGELQGRLDKDKLLRYVASEFEQHEGNSSLPKSQLPISSMPLLSLLDNLALPLKIESSERKDCYANKCWRQLVSHNRDKSSIQSQELNVSIANWWMKKQLKRVEIDNIERFCCLGDRHYIAEQSNVFTNPIDSENQAASKYPLSSYDRTLTSSSVSDLHNITVDGSDSSHLGIQIAEGKDWNYIKIPLGLEQEDITKDSTTTYWLILAIEPSLLEIGDRQPLATADSISRATVDRLLGTISHDLKSPLTGIVGLSNLLSSQKLGVLNQRQAEYVRLIHSSGQKLMTIVNDLVELTSLTTGKFELKPEAIDLKSLCGKLYQQAIAKFSTTNSTESDLLLSTSGLKLNINPELETTISDRLRLSSIISHLMLETIKFLGSPSIAIQVEVKPCDRGIAIAVENDRIEGQFSKKEDIEPVGQDTGLNLVIARYLAQALQGDIDSFYAARDCSFILTLPTVDLPSPVLSPNLSETIVESSERHKNLTILCLYPESEVIDLSAGDNKDLNFNLKRWAEQDCAEDLETEEKFSYRHRIIEADGLGQAHTLARIWQLDVIVLDGYQIADSDKYLRSLQKSAYLSSLPLITLDTKTTEAANQIEGLNVYPCLLPAQSRSIKDLMQVIQIAMEGR